MLEKIKGGAKPRPLVTGSQKLPIVYSCPNTNWFSKFFHGSKQASRHIFHVATVSHDIYGTFKTQNSEQPGVWRQHIENNVMYRPFPCPDMHPRDERRTDNTHTRQNSGSSQQACKMKRLRRKPITRPATTHNYTTQLFAVHRVSEK